MKSRMPDISMLCCRYEIFLSSSNLESKTIPLILFFFPSCNFEHVHFWQFFIMSTKDLSQNYENFKLQQAHFFIHFLSHFLRKIFQKKNIFHQIFLGFCCSANQNMQLQEAHKWKFFSFFFEIFYEKITKMLI